MAARTRGSASAPPVTLAVRTPPSASATRRSARRTQASATPAASATCSCADRRSRPALSYERRGSHPRRSSSSAPFLIVRVACLGDPRRGRTRPDRRRVPRSSSAPIVVVPDRRRRPEGRRRTRSMADVSSRGSEPREHRAHSSEAPRARARARASTRRAAVGQPLTTSSWPSKRSSSSFDASKHGSVGS